MATDYSRGEGKLYDSRSEKLLTSVSYQLYEESTEVGNYQRWWGELTLTDYIRIPDGDRYFLELEDKRAGRCALRKRVNKAVSMVPARFFYFFQGTSPLK